MQIIWSHIHPGGTHLHRQLPFPPAALYSDFHWITRGNIRSKIAYNFVLFFSSFNSQQIEDFWRRRIIAAFNIAGDIISLKRSHPSHPAEGLNWDITISVRKLFTFSLISTAEDNLFEFIFCGFLSSSWNYNIYCTCYISISLILRLLLHSIHKIAIFALHCVRSMSTSEFVILFFQIEIQQSNDSARTRHVSMPPRSALNCRAENSKDRFFLLRSLVQEQ